MTWQCYCDFWLGRATFARLFVCQLYSVNQRIRDVNLEFRQTTPPLRMWLLEMKLDAISNKISSRHLSDEQEDGGCSGSRNGTMTWFTILFPACCRIKGFQPSMIKWGRFSQNISACSHMGTALKWNTAVSLWRSIPQLTAFQICIIISNVTTDIIVSSLTALRNDASIF